MEFSGDMFKNNVQNLINNLIFMCTKKIVDFIIKNL